jgi:hypothetical protein
LVRVGGVKEVIVGCTTFGGVIAISLLGAFFLARDLSVPASPLTILFKGIPLIFD